MRALIDTNVVIDVLQKREPFFSDSYAVLGACAKEELEGCFTAKAVTDVFYVMHRYYHDNAPCIDAVRKLYDILTVVDTTASACLDATFSGIADYEDAVVDEMAVALGADVIITRNKGDFRHSKTKAVTPAELFGLLG